MAIEFMFKRVFAGIVFALLAVAAYFQGFGVSQLLGMSLGMAARPSRVAAAPPLVDPQPAAAPSAPNLPKPQVVAASPPPAAPPCQDVRAPAPAVSLRRAEAPPPQRASLLGQVRVVPEQRDGKVVGLRLFGLRPNSLLSALGLKNGDRLESVNGFDLTNPEKALEAYARLRTASRLRLHLNRAGQPLDIDLNIS